MNQNLSLRNQKKSTSFEINIIEKQTLMKIKQAKIKSRKKRKNKTRNKLYLDENMLNCS